MKCSKCGFKARDINGMRKHYLKKHPGAMKHHGPRRSRRVVGQGLSRFCPHCGGAL